MTSFSQWVVSGSQTFHFWAKNSTANSKPSLARFPSGSAISTYWLLHQAGFWCEHDAMEQSLLSTVRAGYCRINKSEGVFVSSA